MLHITEERQLQWAAICFAESCPLTMTDRLTEETKLLKNPRFPETQFEKAIFAFHNIWWLAYDSIWYLRVFNGCYVTEFSYQAEFDR